MGLTKEQKKDYQRDYMRKKRSNKGSNIEGSNKVGLTYPHIIDKLTDPAWRAHLEKVCEGFARREDLKACTYLGGVPLTIVCDWLECTS